MTTPETSAVLLEPSRRLAYDLKSPVMVISSISRVSCGAKKLEMSSFKESDGIEFSADIAAHIIFDDNTASKDQSTLDGQLVDWRCLKLGIVRQRNATTGEVILKFYPTPAYFVGE